MNERTERDLVIRVLDRTAIPLRDDFRNELWQVVAAEAERTDRLPVPTEPRSPAGDRRRPVVLVAVLTAAAAALITALAWIVRPSETLAPSDITVAPVPTDHSSIAPSTTAPLDSVTPSTQPPPASTAPTTVPTPSSEGESITVSYLDPPPIYEPEVFAELDVSGTIALGDGFVVVGDIGDPAIPDDLRLVVVELTGDHGTTTVDVDLLPRVLLAGPGRVVYGEVLLPGPDDSPAPEQRFVAIALEGERAGEVIVDVPSIGHPMDPISDDFFDHSAQGVIDTWNGDAVMSGFVDPLGQPRQSERTDWPLVRYDYTDDIATQVGGPTWPLTIERHPDRPGSMVSRVGAGADGTAVYATWIGPRAVDDLDYSPPTVPVIAALMPDGTGAWYRLPDGWWVADSNVWGTLLASFTDGRTQLAWFDPTTLGGSTAEVSDEMAIARPFVDPDVCPPVAAQEMTWEEQWNEPFAAATDFPVAMQVFGHSATGPAGPHALLLRYRDRPMPHGDATTEPINGWDVRLTMYPNGNADAAWYLPDGGEAYLRVRDLDRAAVVALIESLTPRGDAAAIPGFDSSASEQLGDLKMLHETMNTGLSGRGSNLACRTPDDRIYRVTAVTGDAMTLYLAVLDRPRPHDVALVEGTLIIVGGGLSYAPPFTADKVHNADQATWEALLQQPMP